VKHESSDFINDKYRRVYLHQNRHCGTHYKHTYVKCQRFVMKILNVKLLLTPPRRLCDQCCVSVILWKSNEPI